MADSSARPSEFHLMANELFSSMINGRGVTPEQVDTVVRETCAKGDYGGKRLLLIVPDGTRTAPVGMIFQALHRVVGATVARLDVMIALGTHQPMSEEAICQRLDISLEQRRSHYARVGFINHE